MNISNHYQFSNPCCQYLRRYSCGNPPVIDRQYNTSTLTTNAYKSIVRATLAVALALKNDPRGRPGNLTNGGTNL